MRNKKQKKNYNKKEDLQILTTGLKWQQKKKDQLGNCWYIPETKERKKISKIIKHATHEWR